MNETFRAILQDIYHVSEKGGFMEMKDFERSLGLDGSVLRPILEDLKEKKLIVELPEGFQLTPEGRSFCRSRWV